MNHFYFEAGDLFSIEEASSVIQKSISEIKELNPDLTCEEQFKSRDVQIQINSSWFGNHKISTLKKAGEAIGFLEIFVEKNLKFITIYTSPV